MLALGGIVVCPMSTVKEARQVGGHEFVLGTEFYIQRPFPQAAETAG